jgi:glycosyltransferase involved in cell wall biosynthesis
MLSFQLGSWAAASGDEVRYVTYTSPPAERHGRSTPALPGAGLPGPVTWLPEGQDDGRPAASVIRKARLAIAAVRALVPAVRWAEIVHVHGHGLLGELGAAVAARLDRPVVLTAYGEDVWDRVPRRWRPDLFMSAYRRAAHVVFYGHGLSNRATELGLGRHHSAVVYPPVAPEFVRHDEDGQRRLRAELGIRSRHLLVNVKRFDAAAGQRYLLEALGEVIRTHPDTRLVMCGMGPQRQELEGVAKAQGVAGHVTFTGVLDQPTIARYDAAADAFVLPSLVEAFPTSALEALASGTPVVAADSGGALELRELFGFDVLLVPREHPMALAQAIVQLLDEKRRTRWSTGDLVDREFRAANVYAQYRVIYERVLQEG